MLFFAALISTTLATTGCNDIQAIWDSYTNEHYVSGPWSVDKMVGILRSKELEGTFQRYATWSQVAAGDEVTFRGRHGTVEDPPRSSDAEMWRDETPYRLIRWADGTSQSVYPNELSEFTEVRRLTVPESAAQVRVAHEEQHTLLSRKLRELMEQHDIVEAEYERSKALIWATYGLDEVTRFDETNEGSRRWQALKAQRAEAESEPNRRMFYVRRRLRELEVEIPLLEALATGTATQGAAPVVTEVEVPARSSCDVADTAGAPSSRDVALERVRADAFAAGRSDGRSEVTTCIVCMDRPRGFMFTPCGHVIICGVCAARIMGDTDKPCCPTCRQEPTGFERAFLS